MPLLGTDHHEAVLHLTDRLYATDRGYQKFALFNQIYFCGMADQDELMRHIENLKPQAT